MTPEDLAALRQPTWCRLLPQHFSLLLDRGGAGGPGRESNPETLLFVHHGAQEGSDSSSGSSNEGPGGASQPQAGATDEFGVPETVAQALAEAALMVADPAATHTAAAVSNLTAGPGANNSSNSSSNSSSSSIAGSKVLLAGAAGLAGAAPQQQGSSRVQPQGHEGNLIPRPGRAVEPGGQHMAQL